MRHKCRMAAIETEANAKIRKSLIGRSRPMRGNFVPGDLVYYWRAGNGVHQAPGQWLGPARVIGIEGGNVWVSHRAKAIKCAKEQLRIASPAERENARDADEDWRRRSRRALQTWCTQTAGPDTTAATDSLRRKSNNDHHSPRRNRKNSNQERIQDKSFFIQSQDHR